MRSSHSLIPQLEPVMGACAQDAIIYLPLPSPQLASSAGTGVFADDPCSQGMVAHQPPRETHLKEYLVNIVLTGQLSKADHDWLVSNLTFHSLLHAQHLTLMECILEDIAAGLITVV